MPVLTLPWPPSANHYWRHPHKGRLAGRHLISEEGRRYRSQVVLEVIAQRVKSLGNQSIRIHIDASPPDYRRRDLDNLLKSVQDALCYAGVYKDDSQIDDLRIVRGDVSPPGHLLIRIETIETTSWP